MEFTPQCLRKIQQEYPALTGNYRIIADYIAKYPDKILTEKVRDIAKNCGCDDAQIIRFCKKIGYDGFSAMKESLAMEFLPVNLRAETSTDRSCDNNLKQQFLENNRRTLFDTVESIADEGVACVVSKLTKAKRVYLFGQGASGLVAQDAQIKLLRLGVAAYYLPDTSLNKMLSGLIQKDDAVLAISFSGQTKAVCKEVQAARQRGAFVAGITNFSSSPLAKLCDVRLLTACDEKQMRIGAMASRLSQFLVVDYLIIHLALKDLDKSGENVMRVLQTLSEE